MIKEIIVYTLLCDNCGVDVHKDSGYSGFNDLGFVKNSAMDDGWQVDGDKHYCPSCWSWDDDDNLVINKKQ